MNSSLNESQFLQRVAALSGTDNIRNFFYLAGVYLFLAAVIGLTFWFYEYRIDAGLPFWLNVPVTILAVFLVGAGQHQLLNFAHEATHFTLFRNRWLNDGVSDWFCMFPLFGCTAHYRLQQLAHHEFVNDPPKDQDIAQLASSGHWPSFPMTRGQWIRIFLTPLRLSQVIKFGRARAKYHAIGVEGNPYAPENWRPVKFHVRVGVGYFFGLIALLALLVWYGDPMLLAVVPAFCWAGIVTFLSLIPGHWYFHNRVPHVFSWRATTVMRFTFISALFTGVAWLTYFTEGWTVVRCYFLWMMPLSFTLPLFTVLRQVAQHGNAGKDRLTQSRVFEVGPLARFFVLPFGQAYHLPHHLFPAVPHYRLRKLHELLLEKAEYREKAVIVRSLLRDSSYSAVLFSRVPEARVSESVDGLQLAARERVPEAHG